MTYEERVEILIEAVGEENAKDSMLNIERLAKELNGMTVKINFGDAAKDVNKLNAGMREANRTAISTKRIYNGFSTSILHAGQQMQVLGKTITKMATPMRTLFRSTVWAAGFKLFDLATEGLNKAAQRADILATYKPVFKAMGAGLDIAGNWEQQLGEAYDRVYQSVIGLPTGIDEIVNEWKLLTIATQDYSKGADLAIAANNAILASGANEQAQEIARRELRTLMTTGSLTQKQWDSLRKGIPVAWNAIEQDLQKEHKISGSLLEALKSRQITAAEFGDLLIKEGISGKTKDVVNEMLHTYSAATANISNAFARMGQGILETISTVLKESTGKDLIDYLIGSKDVIDSFSKGAQNWIADNKDTILGFMDAVKSFDWAGFFKGVGEGVSDIMELFTGFAKIMSSIGGERLGKWMAKAPLLGSMLSTTGGLLKGLRSPLAAILTMIQTRRLTTARGGGIIGGILSKVAGTKNPTEAARSIPSIKESFGSIVDGLSGIAKIAGAAVLVTGAGAISFKAIESMLRDVKDISAIASEFTSDDVAAFGICALSIAAAAKLFSVIGEAFGTNGLIGTAITSAATMMVSGAFWTDFAMIKGGMENMLEAVRLARDVSSEMSGLATIPNLETSLSNASALISQLGQISDVLMGKSGSIKARGEVTQGLPYVSSGIRKSMSNMRSALSDMSSVIDEANAIGNKSINENVGGVISSVVSQFSSAFDGVAVGELKTKIYGFVTAIRAAFDEMRNMNEVIIVNGQVTLAYGFEQSVGAVKQKIRDARKNIQKLKSPIYLKIPVRVTFSVTSNFSTILGWVLNKRSQLASSASGGATKSQKHAIGGMVYRARGGDIPKRKGTDTVHAMLTPGEFVTNKRAVNAFGIDFMRKVNSLDMRGALRSLQARIGNTSNVTNYYNNNQKVVQNITTNSVDFAFRSASRYAGAF